MLRKVRDVLEPHDEYLILKQCIVPGMNYGPMLEMVVEGENEMENKKQYIEMDKTIAQKIQSIGGI